MNWPEPPTKHSVDSWLRESLRETGGSVDRTVAAALGSRPPIRHRPQRLVLAGGVLSLLLVTAGLTYWSRGASPDAVKSRPLESFLIDNTGDVVTVTAASGQVRAIVMGRNP